MATSSISFRGELNQALWVDGIVVKGEVTPAYREILTPEALKFLGKLAASFEPVRQERLAARVERQAEIDRGVMPEFLKETAEIRATG
ncbi:MAG: hypothetical protein ACRD96_04500, partial [Bryobacteraceae bacterium]